MSLLICYTVLSNAFGALGSDHCFAADGDTLICGGRKVRLTNVYAPELNEPGGRAAQARLRMLIRGRQLTFRHHGQDRYGRLLVEAYVDGRRIEQNDIGPRGGRGSGRSGDRHLLRVSLISPKPRKKGGDLHPRHANRVSYGERTGYAQRPAFPSLPICAPCRAGG